MRQTTICKQIVIAAAFSGLVACSPATERAPADLTPPPPAAALDAKALQATGPEIRNSHISGGEVAATTGMVILCAAAWTAGIPACL